MECPGCKEPISDDSHFCRLCGTLIASNLGSDDSTAGFDDSTRRFHPSHELTRGSSFLGRYRISEELGRGGMGIVYKAEDTKLRRNVALKFLPPEYTRNAEAKERFIHEAQAASSLEHPNICSIHEIEETKDGQMYISMGCYDGDTLQKIIREGPVDIGEVVDFGIQVAQGLQEAHDKGIVHRDIKPSNIIVTSKGRAKVMDFGLAKLAGQTRITKAGTAMGTISYMSPEQARGEDVDTRTDIWSLGVVLYELATGQPPFKGEYDQAVIYSILNEEPRPISELAQKIPQGFGGIVSRCLEKDSTSRYQSAAELEADLGRWREESGLGRPSRYSGAYSRRASSRSLLGIGIPVAAVVLAMLIVALFPASRNAIRNMLGTTAPPTSMKVALLPCTSDEEDGDLRALCDGLLWTLTSHIQNLPDLAGMVDIIPASEVNEAKSIGPSDARVKHRANVALMGTFDWSGDELGICMTRNDVSFEIENGRESEIVKLRGEVRLTDPLANLATWQDTLVVKVLGLLDLPCDLAETKTLSEDHTDIPNAFNHFLRGHGYFYPYLVPRNIDRAIDSFNRAIAEDPSYERAHLSLGRAYAQKYWKTKDPEFAALATASAHRVIEMNEKSAGAQCLLGRISINMGEYASAIDALDAAIALDSTSVLAHIDLASAYRALGEMDKAEETCFGAIRLDPESFHANQTLGYIYYYQGRYDEAIGPFTRLTEIRPRSIVGYNCLGGIYYNQEKWPEATEMFESCLDIDSAPTVISNLGTLYFFQARYADAARMYRKAIDLSDDEYKIRAHLAESQYWSTDGRNASLGNFRKAAEMAEDTLKTDSLNKVILSDLADYYAKLDQNAQSCALLEKVISLDPQNIDVIIHIAETYETLGERDTAIEWIAKAFEMGALPSRVDRYPGLSQLRADSRYEKLMDG